MKGERKKGLLGSLGSLSYLGLRKKDRVRGFSFDVGRSMFDVGSSSFKTGSKGSRIQGSK